MDPRGLGCRELEAVCGESCASISDVGEVPRGDNRSKEDMLVALLAVSDNPPEGSDDGARCPEEAEDTEPL